MSADNLFAVYRNSWTVDDLDGGTWTPNAEAESEINSAGDTKAQRAKALDICRTTPMRGTWVQ